MTNKQMQNSCVDFFLCFEILPFHCPNLVEATCNVRAYTYTNHGTGYKYIRGSIKMSAESLYFCEIQNSTIIQATFPLKYSPCVSIHFWQRL